MIYLDNAATTPVDCEVLDAMLPYLKGSFGNPNSPHSVGRLAAEGVQNSRDKIADVIGCNSNEIYFVSGGTEACNTALKGVCALKGRGRVVLSAIEHDSLLESAEAMKKFGFEVVLVNPDERGIVDPAKIAEAINADTIFVGVMAANNEVGTLQPVEEIGKICRSRGVFYFCDCVQLAGEAPVPVKHCDALAISSHKLYGPKGAGALYLKSGVKISPLVSGGVQERGLRGGTSNIAAIVGFAKAYERAATSYGETAKKIAALRDRFLNGVFNTIVGARLNGDDKARLAANANLSFDGLVGEKVVISLDLNGVCASTGAACSAGASSPSHVLKAMGLSDERVRGAVRFTFGKYNTAEEVDKVVGILGSIVETVRVG